MASKGLKKLWEDHADWLAARGIRAHPPQEWFDSHDGPWKEGYECEPECPHCEDEEESADFKDALDLSFVEFPSEDEELGKD